MVVEVFLKIQENDTISTKKNIFNCVDSTVAIKHCQSMVAKNLFTIK